MTDAGIGRLSPYRGLAAFGDTDVDARLFFGRERETELVAANLQAARLTVLYGASGVGKSSLLRAGVTHRLRADDRAGATRQIVAVCSSWRGDPLAAVTSAVAGALEETLGRPVVVTPGRSLADELEDWGELLGGEIYVVLDQLEEYVLYHGADRGGPLAEALAEVVTRPSLRVGVVLGIRDDALADLDAFKARVPGLFGNVLRLDHLTRAEGREAILGPLAELGRLGGPRVTAEETLVDAVLDQVATGQITAGEGRGVVTEVVANGHIEAPYLQLVMERLWEVERARGSDTLRHATLTALGGATRVVEAHLEHALGELDDAGRDAAAAVFGFLVTPSGTKIAHRAADLARYTGVSETDLQPVLDHLAHERIVRPVADDRGGGPAYEIFHDVLADAVLAWSVRHEGERELVRERADARRRHRRLGAVATIALAALAVMTALTVFAFRQRAEADEQAALAEQSAAEAQAALDRVDASEAKLEAVDADLRALRVAAGRERARLARLRREAREVGTAAARNAAEALAQTTNASANEMVATSAEYTTVDPELSLLLAVHAADLIRTSVVENALRTAIRLSNVRTVLPAAGPVTTVGYGGGLLLAASEDGRARLYRASDRAPAGVLDHGAPITVAALDRRGALAVTGGADGTVVVWSTGTGRTGARFRHAQKVTAASFQPGGRLVLTASLDRTVRLTQAPNGKPVASYAHPAPVAGAEWSGDGTRIVVWGGRQVALLDATGKEVEAFAHDGKVVAAIDADGSHVATGSGSRDGTVRIFSTGPGATDPLELAGHVGAVFDLAFGPDGATLAAGGADGVARVWDVVSGDVLGSGGGHRNFVTRVLFSPDGKWLVTASRDGSAVVRSVRGSGDGSRLAGHRDRVNDVAFSPDGRLVATAGDDGDARVWDAGTATQLVPVSRGVPRAALQQPPTVAFSPDGRLVARARGKVVLLVDRRSGKRLEPLEGHRAAVTSVRFSKDGRQILTASKDHDARVWSVPTRKTVHLLIAHFAAVADARWSPDGHWIVTAGPTTAGLWLAESGAFVGYVRGPEPPAVLRTATFGRDSRAIFTRERDGTTRRWFCDICGTTAELQRLGEERLGRSNRVWTTAELVLLRR